MSYTYEYPRPAMTADILLFKKVKESFSVLLVKRKFPPYQNSWALPGGFMEIDETLAQTARRELMEETGIQIDNLKPFRVFDALNRDPRGRNITLVFYAVIDDTPAEAAAGDDAAEIAWFDTGKLPVLGFDHEDVLALAKKEILGEERGDGR